MGLLSNESVSMPASGFADGVEFEETFPEPAAEAVPSRAPAEPEPAQPAAPAQRPHLTVVRDELETAAKPAAAANEAVREDPLERRLREAEALVTETVERMRAAEERRLADWVRERRGEEEGRLAAWVEDRRASVERSLEQRSAREDDLARRLEEMLVAWQSRFEQRLEQRHADDVREAERRRRNDEDRLRAWRGELEQALQARFAERHAGVPLPERGPAASSTMRDALRAATSVRDVGRLLRDALSDMATTSALALSIHHADRDEVAYRYRVAAEDEIGAALRGEALDDGPRSAAANADGWTRAQRAVRAGSRNATVHTAQCAVRLGDATIGVITLQTEGDAIAETTLARAFDLLVLAGPRLAELRHSGAYRGA